MADLHRLSGNHLVRHSHCLLWPKILGHLREHKWHCMRDDLVRCDRGVCHYAFSNWIRIRQQRFCLDRMAESYGLVQRRIGLSDGHAKRCLRHWYSGCRLSSLRRIAQAKSQHPEGHRSAAHRRLSHILRLLYCHCESFPVLPKNLD